MKGKGKWLVTILALAVVAAAVFFAVVAIIRSRPNEAEHATDVAFIQFPTGVLTEAANRVRELTGKQLFRPPRSAPLFTCSLDGENTYRLCDLDKILNELRRRSSNRLLVYRPVTNSFVIDGRLLFAKFNTSIQDGAFLSLGNAKMTDATGIQPLQAKIGYAFSDDRTPICIDFSTGNSRLLEWNFADSTWREIDTSVLKTSPQGCTYGSVCKWDTKLAIISIALSATSPQAFRESRFYLMDQDSNSLISDFEILSKQVGEKANFRIAANQAEVTLALNDGYVEYPTSISTTSSNSSISSYSSQFFFGILQPPIMGSALILKIACIRMSAAWEGSDPFVTTWLYFAFDPFTGTEIDLKKELAFLDWSEEGGLAMPNINATYNPADQRIYYGVAGNSLHAIGALIARSADGDLTLIDEYVQVESEPAIAPDGAVWYYRCDPSRLQNAKHAKPVVPIKSDIEKLEGNDTRPGLVRFDPATGEHKLVFESDDFVSVYLPIEMPEKN